MTTSSDGAGSDIAGRPPPRPGSIEADKVPEGTVPTATGGFGDTLRPLILTLPIVGALLTGGTVAAEIALPDPVNTSEFIVAMLVGLVVIVAAPVAVSVVAASRRREKEADARRAQLEAESKGVDSWRPSEEAR